MECGGAIIISISLLVCAGLECEELDLKIIRFHNIIIDSIILVYRFSLIISDIIWSSDY